MVFVLVAVSNYDRFLTHKKHLVSVAVAFSWPSATYRVRHGINLAIS